jgi:HPt (histidine-containing phosphotransfer) domain-containing protein
MQEVVESGSFIYSSLASDPDFGELVEMFVDEMPDRVQALVDQAQGANWDELTRLAHQLKGSAGSYGFHEITPFARQLEAAAKERSEEAAILRSLDELVAMCRRVRAGQG